MADTLAGFTSNGVTISVQPMPGRKRKYICLQYEGENVTYGIAPVSCEENAKFFIGALAMFAGVDVDG